ncbi:hypothetical protein G4D82_06700 [Flavobacterium sp. CYK-4]|uniref:MbnP family protein n=1 Tax=Flavobacterium lotistagni TaxID=2709660 RepID=UPI001409CFC9|nr:MbnP family protein [Flavobacterium lotistagni]NHM06904.1 hypothetical protein [Flavobacterium lotistagni]
MIKRFVFIGCICFFTLQIIHAQSQDSLALDFHFKFNETPLVIGQEFVSKQKDSLKINTFRFYVSDIQLLFADNSTAQIKESHLVDLEMPATQKISLIPNSKKRVKAVVFSIGVDSLASVSGALSGDLDPTKGMYWAWQSGYINMKIEGQSPSCKTRKNQFQFHIGGYLEPNNALRTLTFNPKKSNVIEVSIDLAAFFDEVPLAEVNSVMIPGKRGIQLADISTKMFSVE